MQVTALGVAGCLHLPLLEERLAQVLDGRCDVAVSRQGVATDDDAVRTGCMARRQS